MPEKKSLNSDGGDAKKSDTKRSNIREFPKRADSNQAAPPAAKLKQPKPPFPAQHQPKPGLEKKLEPKPRYQGSHYRPANKLQGKVALITGGDSGIGRAVAVLYAREGADVAIVYLPQEQPDADETRVVVQKAGRRCLHIPGDVTSSQFCRDAVERTVKEYGKLDILVNNAAF